MPARDYLLWNSALIVVWAAIAAMRILENWETLNAEVTMMWGMLMPVMIMMAVSSALTVGKDSMRHNILGLAVSMLGLSIASGLLAIIYDYVSLAHDSSSSLAQNLSPGSFLGSILSSISNLIVVPILAMIAVLRMLYIGDIRLWSICCNSLGLSREDQLAAVGLPKTARFPWWNF